MSDTPKTDEVMAEQDNWGYIPGSDGDGVTQQEAHDTCFAKLERLAKKQERDLARLMAENERLSAALKKYGDHVWNCELGNRSYHCDCGFTAALKGETK